MYTVDLLPNGLISVFCRRSKLRGTFNPDGTHRFGGLWLKPFTVLALAAAQQFASES